MDGDTDMMDRLTLDLQGFETLGDHGDRLDIAAVRFHLHPVAGLDSELTRESFADLDELLRLENGVESAMLGPEVKVLGQPIGRSDMRESLRLAESRAIILEDARRRIIERERLPR